MSASNVLCILTGSIACYKACDVISRLVQRGHRVRVVATEAARRFVGDATLEALCGEPVRHDLWSEGQGLDHIRLGRWADLILVCPAGAHTLNRIAAGLADDLAGAVLLARDRSRPLLLAPAMNPQMWSHPATRHAVARLGEWGARLIEPAAGRTACGETGEGRLADPELIVAEVDAALARPPRRLRILVTSGGTAEPLDGVRLLTNASTGRTGAVLARHFRSCGHDVVLLRARQAEGVAGLCREETFQTFADLDASLERLLAESDFDAVVHAAAVGDFGVESIVVDGEAHAPSRGKIGSAARVLVELAPRPKLLDSLRPRSRRGDALVVVAFKLTRDAGRLAALESVAALLARGADIVIHNDATSRGPDPDAFPADLHRRGEGAILHCRNRPELAAQLERALASLCPPSP